MNTKDRKENQFVLIEFSEEQQAFNFNLDGADKTATCCWQATRCRTASQARPRMRKTANLRLNTKED